MAKATIRVELHSADSEDYENLHKAIKEEGFSRFIIDSDGESHKLPLAEYNYVGNNNRQEILYAAMRAAKSIGFEDDDYEVLVTMSDGRTWHNI